MTTVGSVLTDSHHAITGAAAITRKQNVAMGARVPSLNVEVFVVYCVYKRPTSCYCRVMYAKNMC